MYDRKCDACGWEGEALERYADQAKPCPACGAPTARIFRSVNIIPDTFATPLVDDHMTRERQVFTSRSEHKAAMRRHGVTQKDTHVGIPGSDKSPQTTKWL